VAHYSAAGLTAVPLEAVITALAEHGVKTMKPTGDYTCGLLEQVFTEPGHTADVPTAIKQTLSVYDMGLEQVIENGKLIELVSRREMPAHFAERYFSQYGITYDATNSLHSAPCYSYFLPAQAAHVIRASISLGLLHQARKTLQNTLRQLQAMGCDRLNVIGIEPSEILTFRDEAVDLLEDKMLRDCARHLSKRTLLLEEFILHEHEAGRFNLPASDTSSGIPAQHFLLHGHCHQKALAGMSVTEKVLAMIPNATVNTIPSGCCGMAGVFGYEKEHYALSMQIGDLILFPAIREADDNTRVIASGASCRQQILAATGCQALHPAEVLCDVFGLAGIHRAVVV
jgi:Fe-S oxidoreductase